ncbi:hypothetical protein IV102_30720 [bacterium]|nr:hypothetical protein [bacterium]
MQVSGSLPPRSRGGSPKAPASDATPWGSDSVSLGQIAPVAPGRPQFSPDLCGLSVSPELGQVQVKLLGRDLFCGSESLGFLGAEAARSIGDGARWRHPFPQDWPWPPKEPRGLNSLGHNRFDISDPDFLGHYGTRPSVWVDQDQQGVTRLQVSQQTLAGAPKSAWVVAPLAMPGGHSLSAPQAMAVFPILDPAEVDQLHRQPGTPASQTWDYDGGDQLMFVTPGADLQDNQKKGYFSARGSLFGRLGDSHIMSLQSRGGEGNQAFQVFAGIHNYVELEWTGRAAEQSQLEVTMTPVELKSLKIDLEGRRLERLGQTSLGLKAEMQAVARALRP